MTARSARLEHIIEGPDDAPVLILSNSLGTTYRMWDGQAEALTESFRLLRYNHRGHRGSETPVGPYSVEEIGEDLLSLMDELGIERASFCGLSLGGMVGMWLASEAPERVERLVLCCTSAHFGRDQRDIWDTRASVVRDSGIGEIEDAVVERWFTPAFFRSGAQEVGLAREMLRSNPDEGYANCCEAVRDMDLRVRLRRISAPTLVIAASEDRATPPDYTEFIQSNISGSRLTVVQDAAHVVAMERPGIVTELILEHLDSAGHR